MTPAREDRVTAYGDRVTAYGDLVGVLAEEVRGLRRLLPLLEAQERALVSADARATLELAERQAVAAAELRAIEGRRQAVAGRLAAECALPRDAVRLSTLLARFPAAPAELPRLRAELSELGTQVLALARRNAWLLDRSLGYVGALLRAVVDAAAPTPTYAASGRARSAAQALGVVDRRA